MPFLLCGVEYLIILPYDDRDDSASKSWKFFIKALDKIYFICYNNSVQGGKYMEQRTAFLVLEDSAIDGGLLC